MVEATLEGRCVPRLEELVAAGTGAGLDRVGVASADPFVEARQAIESRKDAGLHGGMQFTFRNPQRSTDPRRTLPSARSLVVAALSYAGETPERPAGQPVGEVARYARADRYGDLRRGLEAIAAVLSGGGWRSVVLVDDNALVDRAAAHRAGLAWYGKSSNLIFPGRGSWFVVGSVLTEAPLSQADEPLSSACGSCTQCLDKCPTGAIVGPGVVDARRCLAWLLQMEGDFPLEHRSALGGRIYGCDTCQEVCPPNRGRRAPGSASLEIGGEVAADSSGGGAWVPLLDLLSASDDELLADHGRWYIPRRDPRYLRRNALVALGNVGDGEDGDVRAVVLRYAEGSDEMLRRHARWAAEELGVPTAASEG